MKMTIERPDWLQFARKIDKNLYMPYTLYPWHSVYWLAYLA